jgi:hypothetical protein
VNIGTKFETLVREFNYDHRLEKKLSRTTVRRPVFVLGKIRKSNRVGITYEPGKRLTVMNLECNGRV